MILYHFQTQCYVINWVNEALFYDYVRLFRVFVLHLLQVNFIMPGTLTSDYFWGKISFNVCMYVCVYVCMYVGMY